MLDGGIRRTVRSDCVELALIEAGDRHRPTLVFVHAYPDTKELWDEVLTRLARRYHVVAYDVRGAGESSRPRGAAAYDLARLGDDLEMVIAAVSPERPVHLVGHDWGAIQGWEIVTLERFSGKLASFTAVAGPPLEHAAAVARELGRCPTPDMFRALAPCLRRSWYVAALCMPGVPTLTWRWLLAGGRWARLLRHMEGVAGRGEEPAPDPDRGRYPRLKALPSQRSQEVAATPGRRAGSHTGPTGDPHARPLHFARLLRTRRPARSRTAKTDGGNHALAPSYRARAARPLDRAVRRRRGGELGDRLAAPVDARRRNRVAARRLAFACATGSLAMLGTLSVSLRLKAT